MAQLFLLYQGSILIHDTFYITSLSSVHDVIYGHLPKYEILKAHFENELSRIPPFEYSSSFL